MDYDVIVIGAGISGLTAGSLLAKQGIKVAVIDKNYSPGGSCGSFKRKNMLIDQGSAMIFGFGEKGFNSHRFVFNCLQEPIKVIRHSLLYTIQYKEHRIKFYPNIKQFAKELGRVFPKEKENILRFYKESYHLYQNVIVAHPTYTTPDEMDSKNSMKAFMAHPLSYAKFLGYMNKNTKELLASYFTDPDIFKFFDKLTSTYCYTTVKETPAILSAVMFVDNHVGGSYYPAGSSMYLPGKMEKVIEEHGGDMLYQKEVKKIVFEYGKPVGVELLTGEIIRSKYIIYSGTVWNLYKKILPTEVVSKDEIHWVNSLVPTYPSVMLYALEKDFVIDKEASPIEMLIANPSRLDESEVTIYIPSIDDHTICEPGYHAIMAIGPSFDKWIGIDKEEYKKKKKREEERLIEVLTKRFPDFKKGVVHSEVGTPATIKRYCNKNKGAVAGPKQMLGQHMLYRLHTKSKWKNLFYCGESTVMGTGTPTVTVSGIAACNAVLKKMMKEPYTYKEGMKNYVEVIEPPYTRDMLYIEETKERKTIREKASRCQYCEHPTCMKDISVDIRGIMRRVTIGNFIGAKKLVIKGGHTLPLTFDILSAAEHRCVLNHIKKKPVDITEIVKFIQEHV